MMINDFNSQIEGDFGPLNDEIRKALIESKEINASDINVRIGKNEILLYGSVLTDAERRLAEEIVKEKAEERVIRNEITLQH